MKTPLTKLLVAAASLTLAACGSSDSDGGSKGKAGSGDGDGERAAAAPKAKVRGSSSAEGDFPATLARATIEQPTTIKARVTSTPAARITVSWTVACRRGRSADTTAGKFTVTDASTKALKVPLRRSDVCEVSASAQMFKRGTLKVQVLG